MPFNQKLLVKWKLLILVFHIKNNSTGGLILHNYGGFVLLWFDFVVWCPGLPSSQKKDIRSRCVLSNRPETGNNKSSKQSPKSGLKRWNLRNFRFWQVSDKCRIFFPMIVQNLWACTAFCYWNKNHEVAVRLDGPVGSRLSAVTNWNSQFSTAQYCNNHVGKQNMGQ